LPVALITGTVTFHDGTPVPNPQVFLTQTDSSANTQTYYAHSIADGTYTLIGGTVGPFTLSAQDSDSGLAGIYSSAISDVTQAQTANVTLQPSGKVSGTVAYANNYPASNSAVALTNGSQADYVEIDGNADPRGYYEFDHVALGNFSVQARDDNWEDWASASSTIVNPGDTATENIAFPAAETVFGRLFQPDGVTPDSSGYVSAESLDSSGPLGHFSWQIQPDTNGNYIFSGLQVGKERLNAYQGVAEGLSQVVLDTSGPLQVNITEGNAIRAYSAISDLDGADGFRYDVACDGSVSVGGRIDGTLSAFSYGGFSFELNNSFYSCPYIDSLTPINPTTGATIGPEGMGGVQVTRKVFSPASGGFIRYLDVLTNPTAADLKVTVKVESILRSSAATTELVTAPSATGNTYAVMDNSGACCTPVLGFVFAGPNANVPVTATHFANQDTTVSYTWNVPVPAGKTVIVMHYGIQRNVTDDSGATVQAQALVNLTDPNALAGMSAAEQSEVVNFVIP
jgi:hypothetical protein